MNEERQRVLVVHNYYQTPGGEDTVVANEQRLLEDNGHFVLLYSRHNDEIRAFGLLKKLWMPFSAVFSWKTYRKVRALIRENRVDVVHVHNTLPLISPSVYYAAWSMKVPVVQTVHNFRLLCPGATFYRDGHICEDCVEKGLRCAIRHKCYRGSFALTAMSTFLLAFHRLLGTYRRINGYICLTEFNKGKLSRIIPGEKIYVKPNFVYPVDGTTAYDQRHKEFVYVGRLDRSKGIWVLLEAFRQVPEKELWIAGSGPEEDAMKSFITEHDLKNVHMLGFLENELARDLIADAKALIIPTQWYEGFPVSVVESFAAGTCVIGSDIGNVASMIRDHGAGLLFRHDDAADLAKIVKSFHITSAGAGTTSGYMTHENYKKIREIYAAAINA